MNPAVRCRKQAAVAVVLSLAAVGACARAAPQPQGKSFVAPQSQREADERLIRAIHQMRNYSGRHDEEQFGEVKNLLDAGADPNFVSRDPHLSLGGAPLLPLTQAAISGRLELVKLLAANGAQVNAEEGWQPLDAAITGASAGPEDRNRAYAVATFLVEMGADVNRRIWNAIPSESTFPLHVAAKENRLEFVRLLVERGADVNALNGAGQTPLDIAAAAPSAELVELLQARGGLRGSELPAADKEP